MSIASEDVVQHSNGQPFPAHTWKWAAIAEAIYTVDAKEMTVDGIYLFLEKHIKGKYGFMNLSKKTLLGVLRSPASGYFQRKGELWKVSERGVRQYFIKTGFKLEDIPDQDIPSKLPDADLPKHHSGEFYPNHGCKWAVVAEAIYSSEEKMMPVGDIVSFIEKHIDGRYAFFSNGCTTVRGLVPVYLERYCFEQKQGQKWTVTNQGHKQYQLKTGFMLDELLCEFQEEEQPHDPPKHHTGYVYPVHDIKWAAVAEAICSVKEMHMRIEDIVEYVQRHGYGSLMNGAISLRYMVLGCLRDNFDCKDSEWAVNITGKARYLAKTGFNLDTGMLSEGALKAVHHSGCSYPTHTIKWAAVIEAIHSVPREEMSREEIETFLKSRRISFIGPEELDAVLVCGCFVLNENLWSVTDCGKETYFEQTGFRLHGREEPRKTDRPCHLCGCQYPAHGIKWAVVAEAICSTWSLRMTTGQIIAFLKQHINGQYRFLSVTSSHVRDIVYGALSQNYVHHYFERSGIYWTVTNASRDRYLKCTGFDLFTSGDKATDAGCPCHHKGRPYPCHNLKWAALLEAVYSTAQQKMTTEEIKKFVEANRDQYRFLLDTKIDLSLSYCRRRKYLERRNKYWVSTDNGRQHYYQTLQFKLDA